MSFEFIHKDPSEFVNVFDEMIFSLDKIWN